MSLETDFYAAISVSAVSSLVGGRVTPSHMSEGALPPFVVYTPIFAEPRYDLEGQTTLTKGRIQVDCYAEDADTAMAIADAVIAAVPVTGWPLHRTGHTEQDLGMETDTRLFRRMLEFDIFHRS